MHKNAAADFSPLMRLILNWVFPPPILPIPLSLQPNSDTMQQKSTFRLLIPIFITVFLDLLGGGIAIPIFPAIITVRETSILPMEMGDESRKIVFGFLSAIFFIAQFMGAPILGAISDRDGRKKILLLSLAGTAVGYLLFALGIYLRSIELLFFSRFLAGFMGGNIAVALSMISDISTPENKTRNFGLIGAAFGLGFIFGPALGAVLSNHEWGSLFTMHTPFVVSAALTLINMLLVWRNIPETLKNPLHRKVGLFTGAQNVLKAFRSSTHRPIFTLVFLLTFGFTLFTTFFNLFEAEKYGMSIQQIGMVFSFVGIWSVIAQGVLVRPLSKKFKPADILTYSLPLLSVCLILIILPEVQWWQYLVVPFMACCQGLTQPNINTIVTNSAPTSEQGMILGINQSVQSLAMAIPPIVAGFLSSFNIHSPNIAAALFTLLGWGVLVRYVKGK